MNEFGGGAELEFGFDVLAMAFDGLEAELELLGDVASAHTDAQELENVKFSIREPLKAVGVFEPEADDREVGLVRFDSARGFRGSTGLSTADPRKLISTPPHTLRMREANAESCDGLRFARWSGPPRSTGRGMG